MSRFPHRTALSIFLFIAVLFAPWESFLGQSPAPGEIPAPIIRVSTRLMLLDVVVTDKEDKPVSGL